MLTHVATSYLTAGFQTGRYGTAHHSIVPYQVTEIRLLIKMLTCTLIIRDCGAGSGVCVIKL